MEELAVEIFRDFSAVDLIRQLVTHRKAHVSLVIKVLWVEGVRVVILAVCHVRIQVIYVCFIRLVRWGTYGR